MRDAALIPHHTAARDHLVAIQRRDGPDAGSWDADTPRDRGGRLMTTALHCQALAVYSRFPRMSAKRQPVLSNPPKAPTTQPATPEPAGRTAPDSSPF